MHQPNGMTQTEINNVLAKYNVTQTQLNQLQIITARYEGNFQAVQEDFCEALKKDEWENEEILEQYGENRLHLIFMAGDPDEIVLENSDNEEYVQFGIKNYDIDVQQIQEDLGEDSADLMIFNAIIGNNEEETERKNTADAAAARLEEEREEAEERAREDADHEVKAAGLNSPDDDMG